jgi:hypothetical protein
MTVEGPANGFNVTIVAAGWMRWPEAGGEWTGLRQQHSTILRL